jgi:hypothetical protein
LESLRGPVAEAWKGLKDDERRAELEDRLTAVQEPSEDFVARLTPDWSGLKAWSALSHKEPTAEVGQRAREVLRDGGSYFDDTKNLPGGKDHPEAQRLRVFTSGRAREAALRILSTLPPDMREPGDADLARAELTEPNWVSKTQALLTLAAMAEAQDAPLLVEEARSQYLQDYELEHVLETACQVGGRDIVLALLDSDKHDHAAIGASVLAGAPDVTTEELVELLYHHAEGVRAAALSALIDRSDSAQLEQLLDEYPRRPGPYYYNVMAQLDWHLYLRPLPRSD